MAPDQPISVPGLSCIVFGVAILASAFYQPFDPNFCVDGCGIIGNLIPKLMGILNSVTGQWGPRLAYLGIAVLVIVMGWRQRVKPKKQGTDAI